VLAIVALAALSIRLDGEIHKLNTKINTVKNVGMDIERQRLNKDKETKEQQQQIQQNLQQQIDDLKQRVQAKQNSLLATVIPAAQASDNGDAKMFIYMKESGNRPSAINRSSGACGLGQALPCSKMPCSLSDYACQDAFFTRYMQARYGTWENARAFWLSHRWW
jgi:hypothetical protein